MAAGSRGARGVGFAPGGRIFTVSAFAWRAGAAAIGDVVGGRSAFGTDAAVGAGNARKILGGEESRFRFGNAHPRGAATVSRELFNERAQYGGLLSRYSESDS